MKRNFYPLPLTTSVNRKQQGIPFVVVDDDDDDDGDDDDDDDDDDDRLVFWRREATAVNTSVFAGYFFCC